MSRTGISPEGGGRATEPARVRRVLFVCTGNICRSPLGEAIFRHQVAQAGRAAEFEVDSAGTHDYHVGERADPRARRAGEERGVEVPSVAREVERSDFERFDLILAMDRGHLRALHARCPPALREKVRLMREFDDPPGGDVPDPYYSDQRAFDEVFVMLDRCCRRLLAQL